MTKIEKFLSDLEALRKPKSRDPYDVGRITHCWIHHEHKGKIHKFDVRGWGKITPNNELDVSVVNWTLCAGTAILTVKEDTVDKFIISEEYGD